MEFGQLLKKTRKMAGLTQQDLAVELNMSRTNVSKLERNKLELKAADLFEWLKVTQAQELAAFLLCGVDIGTVAQNITQLIGGFILWAF